MSATVVEAGVNEERVQQEPSVLSDFWAGVSALLVKESRWRMRGRRAFVIVTVYVALLGLLVFAVQRLMYDAAITRNQMDGAITSPDLVSGWASAAIGQAVFTAILIVQTLLTVLLAPALSSGTVSMEREKQTLDLLITTPASTLGMVVGKLVSSLAYLVLLTLASIPLMSLVFAFGGIAPEDVVRAYVMLFALGFGVGSIGLFMSAWLKRTQIATAISYLVVFALCIGSLILHTYLLANSAFRDRDDAHRRPSEVIVWLNPFVADIDLLCTAIPDSATFTCGYTAAITGREIDALDPPRDAFWPRSALAYIALGVALTLASTQLIAPSRRLRRRRAQPEPESAVGGVPAAHGPEPYARGEPMRRDG